ncbi:hypothetical protein ACVRZD_05680 [Streptococcus hongkongensis]|nr:hypothetical protein NC01_05945 [Streptococcus uberis]
MIKLLMKSLTGKKSFEEYKKSIQIWSVFLFFIASLTLIINWKLHLPSFGKGFLIGVALALFILIGRNYYLLSNEKKLKEAYLSAYDERNQQILLVASSFALSLQIVIVIIGLFLFVFWSIEWSMIIFLSIDLYVILISFLGTKLLLSKMM